jgi:hypothetical protein
LARTLPRPDRCGRFRGICPEHTQTTRIHAHAHAHAHAHTHTRARAHTHTPHIHTHTHISTHTHTHAHTHAHTHTHIHTHTHTQILIDEALFVELDREADRMSLWEQSGMKFEETTIDLTNGSSTTSLKQMTAHELCYAR